jgi:hypothetical protein
MLWQKHDTIRDAQQASDIWVRRHCNRVVSCCFCSLVNWMSRTTSCVFLTVFEPRICSRVNTNFYSSCSPLCAFTLLAGELRGGGVVMWKKRVNFHSWHEQAFRLQAIPCGNNIQETHACRAERTSIGWLDITHFPFAALNFFTVWPAKRWNRNKSSNPTA